MTPTHKAHLRWLRDVEAKKEPKPIKVSFRVFRTLETQGYVKIIESRGGYEVATLTPEGITEADKLEPKYETREVLAGAYKAGKIKKTLLTHLVDVNDNDDAPVCGKAVHIADRHASTEEALKARPTCPRCASVYDKSKGGA